MKNYILPTRLLSTWLLAVISFSPFAWGQEMRKGAFILISTEGDVNYLDEQGLEANPVAVGKPIPSTYSVETGQGGKLVGLLSNGTLLTLVENTKMKIGTFQQEPFEAGDKKLADLSGEPSTSNVSVDLDFGALVVKTKKLSKGSVFNINSPVGVAGIRGTEFQMASQPGQGVQLDVTESTVAFAPPGGGPPVDVSQGGGLSVSPSGVPTQRPVNPSVAQNIQSTNQAATEATNDVSLGEVTAAMDQASSESESSEEQSSEESSDEGEEESAEESESGDGDSEESDSGDSDSGSDSEGSSETDAMEEPQASNEADAGESAVDPEVASAPAQAETNIDAVLETNADAKQTRKTGEVGTSANEIAGLGLNAEQMEKFFDLPIGLQEKLKSESPQNVQRFINIDELTVENLETFYRYSSETRRKILRLENDMMVPLLEKSYEEELLSALLTQENLDNSKSNKTPDISPDDERITQLGDVLRASGNGAIFDEISEMNQGKWTDEWIETAEIANYLTQDYDFSSGGDWNSWEDLGGLDVGDALENPFFEEVAATYDELDHLAYALVEDHLMIGGSSISMGTGNYDLGDFLENRNDFLIGASENLNLSGTIGFESDDPQNTRVVMMSGGSLTAADGLNLQSAISDLVVSAREDVLLKNASVDALNNLAIQSLRDINMENASLSASQMMRIQAVRDLNVDGLQISQNLPNLIMEATTIRLSNIDFPSITNVNLNSLKGPIDGRYPNFGTNIPASEQLGRVNFIQNVSAGGTQNIMHNKNTFDQHGKNITIGKITP